MQATVTVLNATTKEGFARDISGALQRIGFELTEPDTTEPAPTTTVQHAPGQANYGRLVASYLSAPATLVESPDLGAGEVVVVAGADFTTVHDQPAPDRGGATTTGEVRSHGQQRRPTPTAAPRRRPARRRPRPRPKSTRSSSAKPRGRDLRA